jgi:linoleate 9S-lipoxygenase
MLGGLLDDLMGGYKNAELKGSVVLMRKDALELNDFAANAMDNIFEFLGVGGITCQLISSTVVDRSEHSHRIFSLCHLCTQPRIRVSVAVRKKFSEK